ncbi:MAG: oligosaccharide flippase family protein [Anaerolineae bacterium]|nr:oligosaccharide flippase family protein [Anaerolineae bacterium]
MLAIIFWHRLTPEIHIQRHQFEWAKFKSMFSMSSWLIINQIGSLLFLNIDLIIINRYLGAEAQGRYASALQWAVLLRTFSIAVAAAITPIALDRHVRQDQRQLAKMAHSTVKWLGLALALPVGLLIGFAVPLLHIWLGSEFEDIALLMIVLVGHLSFNLAVRPLFSIQVALNKVRWPAIVSIILGVFNLFLALWWVHWGKYGLGVAVASGIVLTLRNAVFVPIYGARIQNLPWYTFYKSVVPGMLGLLLAVLISFVVANRFNVESWVQLVVAGICVAFPYIAILFFFLTKEEKQIMQRYLRKRRF